MPAESAEAGGDDGLSDEGGHSADMMVEEGDEVTDSDLDEEEDDDEVDVLEDGCNSAGEEVCPVCHVILLFVERV